MLSVDEIRENYLKFEDSQIEKIARNESKTLRRDVLVVLKDEIERRNLDINLITWVDAENNPFTGFEKTELIRKIAKLRCPNCGEKKTNLSGHEYTTIISMLILCKQKTHKKILCSNCASNKKFHSYILTALTGWWSRSGILLTPYTLIKEPINTFYKKKISARVTNEFLETFNGLIRLRGTENVVLEELIRKYNNPYE